MVHISNGGNMQAQKVLVNATMERLQVNENMRLSMMIDVSFN